MTMQRFQSTVRVLSNSMFVRWYACLNYPYEPQVLGIQFQDAEHTNVRLMQDLREAGFTQDPRWPGIWVVERTEDGTT